MSVKNYGLTATMNALRAIFEKNQDKPFERRWALARCSEAYRGFQTRCGMTAKVLFAFAVPPLLFWLIVSRNHATDSVISRSAIVIAGLYIAIGIAVSWKLGIKLADARMRSPQQTDQGSG